MSSKFLVGNAFLLASMLCATGSQFLTKVLLDEVQPLGFDWATLRSFLVAGRLVRATLAGALLVSGYLCWLLALVRLDLSYAYPVACSSLLFVAFFSAVFLGEAVTARIWSGTILILLGLILLVPGR